MAISHSIHHKLQEYIGNSRLYPMPSLEDFCNSENILINELYDFASDSKELSHTIACFKQKQKALVMQLLTVKGNIKIKDKNGQVQEVTLDKKGVFILAKRLGIG